LKDNLSDDKQTQLKNQIAVIESKLNEIKEELSLQLFKCCEMFSPPNVSSAKPSPLIANTVVTILNEEKEREKRQLSLIVHNLVKSNATEGKAR